ncbi:MAG: hypothetical protein R6W72_02310 [Desulfurivibrionaceae bacterium]
MKKKANIILQLSIPRSGSNITCRFFGAAADACSVALAIDVPTGVPYSGHVANTLDRLSSYYRVPRPVAYIMEHAACLTEDHLKELAAASDVTLVTQRDPSLLLESMLRKLLLHDNDSGIQSRVDIHMEEMCMRSEARIDLAKRLVPGNTGLAKDVATDAAPAISATRLLNEFAKSKGFNGWAPLQKHMLVTRDYHLAEGVLRCTHPDIRNQLSDYASPQDFITYNPFNFLRACSRNVRLFMQHAGAPKLLVVDATSFRSCADIRTRTAVAAGLQVSRIPVELTPQNIRDADIAEAAIVFMNRALSSSRLDKPFENPIRPDQLPKYLTESSGLFWELVDRYIMDVFSVDYIRPSSWSILSKMIDYKVVNNKDKSVTLMERNPIFSYANVAAMPDAPINEQQRRLIEIREHWPSFSEVFDRISTDTGSGLYSINGVQGSSLVPFAFAGASATL